MKKQALASNPILWQIQAFIGERILWILGIGFILLMWWYIQTDSTIKSNQNPQLTREIVPLKKGTSTEQEPEEPEEPEPEKDMEEIEEKQEIRKAQAKATLNTYQKTTKSTEFEELESLLNRYGLAIENIREFPEELLEELSEEEASLLAKYQNLESNLDWARRQVVIYEGVFKKNPKMIRKERQNFLKKITAGQHHLEIECALLEKLSDPFLEEPFFEEVVVLLQMSGSEQAFDTILFLFQQKKTPSKKTFLLKMLMNIDFKKATPLFFQSLENPSELDLKPAQEFFWGMVSLGNEDFLGSFLENKNPVVVQTAQNALLRLNSPKALALLYDYEKKNLSKNKGISREVQTDIQKKLDDPDVEPLDHREAVLSYGILNPTFTFQEIEERMKKEERTEKRVNWYLLMVKIDKTKTIPYLIQSIDSRNDYETGVAKELLQQLIVPGMESVFEPHLNKQNSLVPRFARTILLQLDTPVAKKMLKSMNYVEDEPAKEVEEDIKEE